MAKWFASSMWINRFAALLWAIFVLANAKDCDESIRGINNTVPAIARTLNGENFDKIVDKIEDDVRMLAQYVEEIYSKYRCDNNTIALCSKANYDHCLSSFPNATCEGGEDFHNPDCGDVRRCTTKVSFTSSVVALRKDLTSGPDRNPTDRQIIESICFSRLLDDYFMEKRKNDTSFWKQYGQEPTAMYFASKTGAFRLYPARHYLRNCGIYDHFMRPFYVAASSGPKNVVMILDVSETMDSNNKIRKLKNAASRIVSTLTASDRITIVPFSDEAYPITDDEGFMLKATPDNKDKLLLAIDGLNAKGGTNVLDAFEKALYIFDQSKSKDRAIECKTAVIFFTDGTMTLPNQTTKEDVVERIRKSLEQAQIDWQPIYLFTYSVPGVDSDTEFLSRLACAVPNGVWTEIANEDQIVESLSSYYKLFSLGLGANENSDFVAWVLPYLFASINQYGTTASVPVYDRRKTPPLFLGVVAIDFLMPALDDALGVTDDSSYKSIERKVNSSQLRCSKGELRECVWESFRRQGTAGNMTTCPSNCTDDDRVPIEEQPCDEITESDYPKVLWANVDSKNRSDLDATCCPIDGDDTMTCPLRTNRVFEKTWRIVLVCCGVVVLVLIVVAIVKWRTCQDQDDDYSRDGPENPDYKRPDPVVAQTAGNRQTRPSANPADERMRAEEEKEEEDEREVASVKNDSGDQSSVFDIDSSSVGN
ncbi:hypothetical protein ACA910_007803 [Epithemia clementina (nom. ined.)]